MSKKKIACPPCGVVPLSVEQLEAGLRIMKEDRTCVSAFWEENVGAFGQTVLVAICETRDALLSPTIPPRARVELEGQLEILFQYFELADRYIAGRSFTPKWLGPAPRSELRRIH